MLTSRKFSDWKMTNSNIRYCLQRGVTDSSTALMDPMKLGANARKMNLNASVTKKILSLVLEAGWFSAALKNQE